ncbi:MAG: type II secretion system major pseudopilin GspG [Campylobacterales bacterium]|nr:type II secretion system major pseudopilin GspG [Campylobacterales bacterium]HEO98628.1 type II secretion system protein GspG [Campylobacterota bacterium]
MKNRKNLRKAFSLIELLIVIAILGLLVAMVAPSLMDRADQAKRDQVCIQMAEINKALDMFKLDNGVLPDTEEGIEALLANPDPEKYPGYSVKPYMERLPKDAWKSPFTYINQEGTVELISFGSDRKEGGEEFASDIFFTKECQK